MYWAGISILAILFEFPQTGKLALEGPWIQSAARVTALPRCTTGRKLGDGKGRLVPTCLRAIPSNLARLLR